MLDLLILDNYSEIERINAPVSKNKCIAILLGSTHFGIVNSKRLL